MEVLPASQPEYAQTQIHFLSSNPLFLLCLCVPDPVSKHSPLEQPFLSFS